MSKTINLLLALELLIIIIVGIITLLIIYPILDARIDFPFLKGNIMFVVAFLLGVRYLFFLKYSLLDKFIWVKVAFILISVLIVISLIYYLFQFNGYINEEGLQELTYHLKFKEQVKMMSYIRKEMLFFGVGSIIALSILPIRLLISVWKDYNSN